MRALFFCYTAASFRRYVKNHVYFLKAACETDVSYLKIPTQWSEAMAEVIAAQEGITLAVEHWEVVRFVREFTLNLTPLRRSVCWSRRWPTSLAKRRQQPLSLSPVPERTAKRTDLKSCRLAKNDEVHLMRIANLSQLRVG